MLPSSGPLSLLDIAGEFGGIAPHSMSEYYLGGGLVPSSVLSVGGWTPYDGSAAAGAETAYILSAGGVWFLYAAGVQLLFNCAGNFDLKTISGTTWQYQRGSYFADVQGASYYQIRRRTYSSVSANGGVPTTGTLTAADFYGATST